MTTWSLLRPTLHAAAAGPVLLPSLDARLEAACRNGRAQRAVVQRFLKQELKRRRRLLHAQDGGKDAKPTLSKAGAEKFLGSFKLQASFMPDIGTWEMLGKPAGSGVLRLHADAPGSGEMVGEGPWRTVAQEGRWRRQQGDQDGREVGHGHAVLRTGALSEVYTQDLEICTRSLRRLPRL